MSTTAPLVNPTSVTTTGPTTTADERKQHVLQAAIEFAESNHIFDAIRDQPPFATLLGLIIEQGRRFSVSHAIRGKLWTAFGGKTFTPAEFLAKDNNVLDDIEPDANRRDLMRRVATCFSTTGDWQNEQGIGPWTIAAHEIMCGKDPNMTLTTDAHIRNALKGIATWAWLKQHMPTQLTQLTRLFWRLGNRGRMYLMARLHDSRPVELIKNVHFF